jgi:excisionase family DNA binding protein
VSLTVTIDAEALVAVLLTADDATLRLLLDRLDASRPVRPPANVSDYLSPDEAAAVLRVHKRRVYGLVNERRLSRHGPGRKLLLSRAEVEALAEGTGPRRSKVRNV